MPKMLLSINKMRIPLIHNSIYIEVKSQFDQEKEGGPSFLQYSIRLEYGDYGSVGQISFPTDSENENPVPFLSSFIDALVSLNVQVQLERGMV